MGALRDGLFWWDKVSLAPSLIIIGQWQQSEERQLTINPNIINLNNHVTCEFFKPLWTWVHKFSWRLFETRLNVLQTSAFETASHLSSSSHLSKGNWLPKRLRVTCIGYSHLGIGTDPQWVPGVSSLTWPWEPQSTSRIIQQSQTETTFQSFSQRLQVLKFDF